MKEEFPVNQYWLERGRTYYQEQRLAQPYHRMQETFLLRILKEAGIPLARVLELGCGYGRITRLVADQFSAAHITALDLSPDQLARAREYCSGRSAIEFHPYDFYSGNPFPGSDYDAALAIEVFLHHPASLVRNLLLELSKIARHIVHIDWSEPWPWPVPRHVWLHDYPSFYHELGWACARFQLPEKANGQQQVLFVAAPQLSETLAALERTQPAPVSRVLTESEMKAGPLPWEQVLRQSLMDLQTHVPEGSQLILIDNAEWAMPETWLQRRIIPFTECDGQYWGPPADDEAAWRETQRLRDAGATHLVLGWNAFWYRDQYPQWYHRLRNQYPCLVENERVILFQL